MPKESYYVRRLMNKLRALPRTWWTRVEQKTGIRGTPDIIGAVKCPMCPHSRAVFIEAKTMTGRATALQEENAEQLVKIGAYAKIVRLPYDEKQVIQDLRLLQGDESCPSEKSKPTPGSED